VRIEMTTDRGVTRRRFLQSSTATAALLLLGRLRPASAAAADEGGALASPDAAQHPADPPLYRDWQAATQLALVCVPRTTRSHRHCAR